MSTGGAREGDEKRSRGEFRSGSAADGWSFFGDWERGGVVSLHVFGGGVLGSGKSAICPRCGKEGDVRPASAKGLIEKSLLARFHIHPFRCLHCRSRFRRFSWDPDIVGKSGGQDSESASPTRRDNTTSRGPESDQPKFEESQGDSFEAVIAEVRKAEMELERREAQESGSDTVHRIG